MSATYHCDKCGKQIYRKEFGRVKRKLGNLEVEVMHCYDGCWNAGQICHACIIKVVVSGKRK